MGPLMEQKASRAESALLSVVTYKLILSCSTSLIYIGTTAPSHAVQTTVHLCVKRGDGHVDLVPFSQHMPPTLVP